MCQSHAYLEHWFTMIYIWLFEWLYVCDCLHVNTSLTLLCLVDSPILLYRIILFPKFGMSSILISIFRIFLTEILLSKQRRPWWDAASCSILSGCTLFAKAFFLDARHKWVNLGSNNFLAHLSTQFSWLAIEVTQRPVSSIEHHVL